MVFSVKSALKLPKDTQTLNTTTSLLITVLCNLSLDHINSTLWLCQTFTETLSLTVSSFYSEPGHFLTIHSVLCGLVGGPGLVSGGNFNEDLAVFEQATRNSGRKIAGQNLANPTAYLTSTSKVSMMHLYDSSFTR